MSSHTVQKRPKKWRSREQIAGVESQLTYALRYGYDDVTMPLTVAKALVEICQQARWIERLRERDVECLALRHAQDMQVAELLPEVTP